MTDAISTNGISFPEWAYLQDEVGIVYCLGRSLGSDRNEAVATYYRVEDEDDMATKQKLEGFERYRRFIYQGLPEERSRMDSIECEETATRLLYRTETTGVGFDIQPSILKPADYYYRDITYWLGSDHIKARAYQKSLQIVYDNLDSSGVEIEELSLYGAAAFGMMNISDKVVDDIDIVFSASNIDQLKEAVNRHQSDYSWADIDPAKRLPEKRQRLKAKRWATSQIRIAEPYWMSVDLKVARDLDSLSLWDELPGNKDTERFEGMLKVTDDHEAICTSPAVVCEDQSGNERILLMEGYQYIGCAVLGDLIDVRGSAVCDSSVIVVSQADYDIVVPDFSTLPLI